MTVTWTNLLARTALSPLLDAHPVIALDVGSRGGFERDLAPLAFAVNAHGFEPEAEAFNAIAKEAGAWRSVTHHPVALSGKGGERSLYITRNPVSCSLLKPLESLSEDFPLHAPSFEVLDQRPMETKRLDDFMADAGLDHLDYLKLDVEGGEFEILQGGETALGQALMVKAETAFLHVREGQPLPMALMSWLSDRGFALLDYKDVAHWRRLASEVSPWIGQTKPCYSKGRLVQGDVLFARLPESLSDPHQAIRSAALLAAHGYFDFALRAFDNPAVMDISRDSGLEDPKQALAKASRAYGVVAWRSALKAHLRQIPAFLRSGWRLMRG